MAVMTAIDRCDQLSMIKPTSGERKRPQAYNNEPVISQETANSRLSLTHSNLLQTDLAANDVYQKIRREGPESLLWSGNKRVSLQQERGLE